MIRTRRARRILSCQKAHAANQLLLFAGEPDGRAVVVPLLPRSALELRWPARCPRTTVSQSSVDHFIRRAGHVALIVRARVDVPLRSGRTPGSRHVRDPSFVDQDVRAFLWQAGPRFCRFRAETSYTSGASPAACGLSTAESARADKSPAQARPARAGRRTTAAADASTSSAFALCCRIDQQGRSCRGL